MRLPLRLRLTLVFALGMAVVLAGFGAFVYLRAGRDLLASVDLGLRARVQVMVGDLGQGAPARITAAGSLIDPDESFAQVLDSSGRVLEASSEASEAPLLPASAIRSLIRPTFFVTTVPRIDTDPLRLLVVPMRSGGPLRFVVAGATLGDRKDALGRLLLSLVAGGPVALALASAAAWLVAGAALRPVERMRREAAAISGSERDRRLAIPTTGDELARLGRTLNEMLDRLQQALDQERRFVDNASHELRTPLSVLKMELDLALAHARTPRELESVVAAAWEETDRLVRLAEDLLVLARMEGGRLPVHRTDVSVGQLVETTAARYADRANGAGARIQFDIRGGRARLDPARVRQAVENLLDNALRHTGSGMITVRSDCADGTVRIAVEDSGPGFPEDFLPRAFEPFARPGTDAGADGAGAGLGLAIVRAVAEAHGGTATAENLPGGGARVMLTLRH